MIRAGTLQPARHARAGAYNAQAFDRYSYVLGNPLKYNDPSGHCWGIASGERFVPGYDVTCNNIDLAWIIIANPNSTTGQRLGASTYVVVEFEAHAVVVAGAATGLKEGAAAVVCAATNCEGEPENAAWDITVEEFLTEREAYENEVRNIKPQAQRMLEDGSSSHEVAEWAYNQRREIGVKYKNITPPDMREEIYQRNIERYGDPLGPSIDYFRERGYTDDEIIDSASRPGGQDIIPRLIERLKTKWK